jgi:diaminohydroxyphosphoribosylaminopyrimidine deaminase / 5-amino-6-(5-phosphoribosylamino)uracil reductase
LSFNFKTWDSCCHAQSTVGAVVVCNDIIIGEGFTDAAGGNHAEVNAIQAVMDKSLLCKSTLYVSLEPCSHFGKTPPCADFIIKNKIPKVVIGCLDTNKIVDGNGVKKLKAAGIEVLTGILEKECQESNKRFFSFHNKNRPYILLKWAESADGFIAPRLRKNQSPVWITNELSRQLVHKWRTEEQAILVGTNTVLADNPQLTARDWMGKNPIRIVLDWHNKLPKTLRVFDNCAETLIISEKNIKDKNNLVKEICELLYQMNIQSVIIEGGRQTLQSFIDADIWDEARVFKSTVCLEDGVEAPIFKAQPISKTMILNDQLFIYKNE